MLRKIRDGIQWLLVMILGCSAVLADSKTEIQYITPENWENLKSNFLKNDDKLKDSLIFRVSRSKIIDWESLTPADYEQTYAQLNENNFFSQFSLKRGYRLEPFLPLLFPEKPEIIKKWTYGKDEGSGGNMEKSESGGWGTNGKSGGNAKQDGNEDRDKNEWLGKNGEQGENRLSDKKEGQEVSELSGDNGGDSERIGSIASGQYIKSIAEDHATSCGEMENSIQNRIKKAKWEVNQTLYEIYEEQFLIPLQNWCFEKEIRLEYVIDAEDFVPVQFLMRDGVRLRHTEVGCSEEGISGCENEGKLRLRGEKIRETVSRQAGIMAGNDGKEHEYREVVLVQDEMDCRSLDEYSEIDILCEFQIPYVKITLKPVDGKSEMVLGTFFAEVGYGSESWRRVRLAAPLSEYQPETQKFLERFLKYNGEIVVK
ncbi:MAG: hypothetical protein Q4C70_04315 [Planctomycetia bacterium]|nr:hypothetical protein [Planctomycetia bacterium]